MSKYNPQIAWMTGSWFMTGYLKRAPCTVSDRQLLSDLPILRKNTAPLNSTAMGRAGQGMVGWGGMGWIGIGWGGKGGVRLREW